MRNCNERALDDALSSIAFMSSSHSQLLISNYFFSLASQSDTQRQTSFQTIKESTFRMNILFICTIVHLNIFSPPREETKEEEEASRIQFYGQSDFSCITTQSAHVGSFLLLSHSAPHAKLKYFPEHSESERAQNTEKSDGKVS
jgi:hypothetical protein